MTNKRKEFNMLDRITPARYETNGGFVAKGISLKKAYAFTDKTHWNHKPYQNDFGGPNNDKRN